MRRLALPILGLAGVLLALWLLQGTPPPEGRVAPAPDARGGGAGPEAAPTAPVDPGRAALTPQASAERPLWRGGSGPGKDLAGWVLDPAGRPLAAAWVVSTWELAPVRSGPDGRFRLPLEAPVRPGSRRTLWAWAPGRALTRKIVLLGPGQEGLRLVLEAARPLDLTVEAEESAAPLPGAGVEWLLAGEPRPGPDDLARGRLLPLPVAVPSTDGEGRTRLPDGGGLVRVRAPGRPPVLRPVGPWNHRIRVPARWELRLRLRWPDGSPAAGVEVAFPQAPGSVRTDAAGTAPVPPEAGGSLAWTEVALGGGRYWVLGGPGDTERAPGGPVTAVVGFRELRGRLLLAEGLAAAELEVASAAVTALSGVGTTWHPDPEATPERLIWQPVAADGGFRLATGWQGSGVGIVVRRREDGRLLAREVLAGTGPWEVPVAASHPVRLRFRARPPEALAGAWAVLTRSRGGWEEESLPPLPLDEAGVAATELPEGRYRVFLALPGETARREVGEFRMPDRPDEEAFDLGALRTLAGTVLAAGSPVFPGRVRLRAPGGGWLAAAALTPDGGFTFRAVPLGPLEARVEPEDAWLEPPRGAVVPVPAGTERLRIQLPAGVLRLALDPSGSPSLDGLWVERRPLPEAEHREWARTPRLPAQLLQGPVDLRVTPARYRFGSTREFTVLEEDEVVLDDGGYRELTLVLRPAARLLVRIPGFSGSLVPGDLELLPVDAGWGTARPQRSSPALGGPGGVVLPAWNLAPGRWRLRLEGPFRAAFGGPAPELPQGPWELDLELRPREEVHVFLEPGETGAWGLRVGLRRVQGDAAGGG